MGVTQRVALDCQRQLRLAYFFRAGNYERHKFKQIIRESVDGTTVSNSIAAIGELNLDENIIITMSK